MTSIFISILKDPHNYPIGSKDFELSHQKNIHILHEVLTLHEKMKNEGKQEKDYQLYFFIDHGTNTTEVNMQVYTFYYAEICDRDITVHASLIPVLLKNFSDQFKGTMSQVVTDVTKGSPAGVQYHFVDYFGGEYASILPKDLPFEMDIKVQKIEEDMIDEKYKLNALSHKFEKNEKNIVPVQKYLKTASGGTFDHFHMGHRLLLTLQLITAKEDIFIGVTSDVMLQKKKYKECIFPIEKRKQDVNQFILELLGSKGNVNVHVFELQDPFGPTITNPEIDSIAASEETLPGVMKINQIREEKKMKPLQCFLVPTISPRCASAKLSSTELRERDLKKEKNHS